MILNLHENAISKELSKKTSTFIDIVRFAVSNVHYDMQLNDKIEKVNRIDLAKNMKYWRIILWILN